MRLPFAALLAARYLKSSRRDAYVSLLSLLAGGGIALGCAALILVLAGLTGLQDFLRSDVLDRTPHLEVGLPEDLADAERERLVAELLALPPVVEAQRLLRGRGWLLVGGRAVDVEVVGFEGELPAFFPEAPSREPGLYVGDLLAARWALSAGDRVELVSPRPTLTPLGPRPRVHAAEIAGLYRTGRTEEQEHRVAVPLELATRLVGSRDVRLEVRATGLEDALALVPRLGELLPPGTRIRTWEDLNRPLFFALRLEKLLMFVSVFLIVPVATLSLVTVLGLLISSKREELGMLRAMGARPADLRRAFFTLGGVLGGGGMVLGTLLGAGGALLLDRFEVLAPPGDVYFVDHIPFAIRAADVGVVLVATATLTAMTTVWAARRVAADPTVEALRR